MVYPLSRSMNADLHEGLTDGKYKKIVRDRGGVVNPATYRARSDLFDAWYGIHETQIKCANDDVAGPTPDFVPNPPARPPVV